MIFFPETYKAILAAKEIEDQVCSGLSLEEDLELVEKALKETRDHQEYDYLKSRKETLERDIKFKKYWFTLDPDMHQVVANNYKKEKEEAAKEHKKRYDKIEKILKQAIAEVSPLIQEINEINEKAANASMVKEVLDGKVPNRKMANMFGGGYTAMPAFGIFPTNNISTNNILKVAEKNLRESVEVILSPNEFVFKGNTIKRPFEV